MITLAIIAAVIGILIVATPRSMRSDLWIHLRRTRCIIRHQHVALVAIGHFTKKGFQPIPLRQCQYCAEIIISANDAIRAGAKVK
jgi:hypothetical protein